MPRFSVASIGAGAGSATLPSFSLYASASKGFFLRDLYVANTTATAARYKLVRLTTRGTPGAGLTEAEAKVADADPTAEAFAAHSVAPTLGTDLAALPVPAGVAALAPRLQLSDPWEGGERGIYVPPGTANGIGVIVASGTGQVLDVTAIWDE